MQKCSFGDYCVNPNALANGRTSRFACTMAHSAFCATLLLAQSGQNVGGSPKEKWTGHAQSIHLGLLVKQRFYLTETASVLLHPCRTQTRESVFIDGTLP